MNSREAPFAFSQRLTREAGVLRIVAVSIKKLQKLEHLTLALNHVLRSLITQRSAEHKVEQPTALANVRIKKRQISNYLKHHSLGS
jgi:glutamate-1-semialdehyde aminotransferase